MGRKATTRRYPLSAVTAKTLALVFAVTMLGTTLYEDDPSGLQALDLRTGRWRRLRFPGYNLAGVKSLSVAADGKTLLIGTEKQILRYDPIQRRFSFLVNPPREPPRPGLIQGPTLETLLGRDSHGGAWFSTFGNTPAEYLPAGGWPPQPLAPVLPAEWAEPQGIRPGPMTPLAYAAGYLWYATDVCLGQLKDYSNASVIIGYDPVSKTWTPPQPFDKQPLPPQAFVVSGGSVYVATGDEHAAVQRYDVAKRQWAVAAPPLPISSAHTLGPSGASLRIVSIEPTGLWFVGEDSLCHFDRVTGLWQQIRIPASPSYGAAMAGYRQGRIFYMAPFDGLWRYDAATGMLKALLIPTQGLKATQIAKDASGLWAMCTMGTAENTLPARLDPCSGRWSVVSPASGYPEWNPNQNYLGVGPRLWDADGEIWVDADQGVYHRDSRTGRWRNVSENLGVRPRRGYRPGLGVHVRDIRADGRYDWILTDSVGQPNDLNLQNLPPPIPALVRYDTQTGRYRWYAMGLKLPIPKNYDPPTIPHERVQNLVVTPQALWTLVGGRLYHVDKSGKSWRWVNQDSSPLLPVGRMTVAQGDVWLSNPENVLRWSVTR